MIIKEDQIYYHKLTKFKHWLHLDRPLSCIIIMTWKIAETIGKKYKPIRISKKTHEKKALIRLVYEFVMMGDHNNWPKKNKQRHFPQITVYIHAI